MSDFSSGKQPCQNLKRQLEENEYVIWPNVHICLICGKLVSYCENCRKDHHVDGYESCIPLEIID